nr:unnamed protein product [Spirometra erinaceieuropaei]
MTRKNKKGPKFIVEADLRTEERFEDFTNVTPWERFVSELLLLLLDWDLNPLPSSSSPLKKIALVKTGYVYFQAMRFRLDYFAPSEETCGEDEDSSVTTVVPAAFGLREFTLLSPADPGVRRLVGTTRIRLLLSSIEMALAESKCALPMLVQYGCNKFYYGLSLKRPREVETQTEGAAGVFCDDFGLLKTQYDMSHFELPPNEMGLARFRTIFDERLEGPHEALSISCVQYYRLLNLHFTSNPESSESPRQTDIAVQHVLSGIYVHLGLNLIVNRSEVAPDDVTSDPYFSALAPTTSDIWALDLVVYEFECSLFGDVSSTILDGVLSSSDTQSIENTTDEEVGVLPSALLVFLGDLISGPDCHIGQIPKDLLPEGVSDTDHLDRELADTLGCLFSNGILLKLAAFLHIVVSHIEEDRFPQALPRVWASFVAFLEDLITSNSPPRFCSSQPRQSTPALNVIEEAIWTLHCHSVESEKRTVAVEPVDDEAFFDAAETTSATESTSHKYSEPIHKCPACMAALKRLVDLPWPLATAQFSQYIVLYQLEAFHRLVVPSGLMSWLKEQLSCLRQEIRSLMAAHHQKKFPFAACSRILEGFQKKLVGAVCMHQLFAHSEDREVSADSLLNLAQQLGERVRDWKVFPEYDLPLTQCFNVTAVEGVGLQQASLRDYCLTRIQSLLPGEPEDDEDDVLRVNALQGDLEIAAPRSENFPTFRIFVLTTREPVRRPNPILSCPGKQRLFVASAHQPATSSSPPGSSTHELLDSLRVPPERNDTRVNAPTVTRYQTGFDVLLAGAFSEDCDIF